MPKITIDGQVCEFEGKKTILQVALEREQKIPHYCYHPGLSIVASCRICLAEVAQPNPQSGKLELIPKLVPTCQTPAVDGAVVYTSSPKSVANQKAVMEFLLINHPLDCPVCDQAGECSLQDYSYEYGRGQSRFQEDKVKQPVKDVGPHVKLYSDRCIMCSRCVRFTREVTGTGELAVFGRGNQEQIDVFPGRPLANELSANVVDLCPVGALLDKDFLFEQRVWLLKEADSVDGVTASGDAISIHHNEGRIYRIKPRYNSQVNKWWISDEIRYGWKFVHSEHRLTSPRRNQLGGPIASTFNRALEQAVQGLRKVVQEHRQGSLAVMVSTMLSIEEAYLLGKVVRTLDPKATLAVGPIPVQGEDKTFPGGYKVYAEKCPNSRGVRRALETLNAQQGSTSNVLSYEAFQLKLEDKAGGIAGLLIAGGYPSAWTTKEFVAAVGKKHLVMTDVLPNDLTGKADVLLPGATWAEKSGTFENASGRLQTFEQAIPVLEGARSEASIALEMLAALGAGNSTAYDPAAIRLLIGGSLVSDVHHPVKEEASLSDLEYVEL